MSQFSITPPVHFSVVDHKHARPAPAQGATRPVRSAVDLTRFGPKVPEVLKYPESRGLPKCCGLVGGLCPSAETAAKIRSYHSIREQAQEARADFLKPAQEHLAAVLGSHWTDVAALPQHRRHAQQLMTMEGGQFARLTNGQLEDLFQGVGTTLKAFAQKAHAAHTTANENEGSTLHTDKLLFTELENAFRQPWIHARAEQQVKEKLGESSQLQALVTRDMEGLAERVASSAREQLKVGGEARRTATLPTVRQALDRAMRQHGLLGIGDTLAAPAAKTEKVPKAGLPPASPVYFHQPGASAASFSASN